MCSSLSLSGMVPKKVLNGVDLCFDLIVTKIHKKITKTFLKNTNELKYSTWDVKLSKE